MSRPTKVAAFECVEIEIKKVTPREARKAKTEAEYNDDNGSIVTESEGTTSHLHQLIA